MKWRRLSWIIIGGLLASICWGYVPPVDQLPSFSTISPPVHLREGDMVPIPDPIPDPEPGMSDYYYTTASTGSYQNYVGVADHGTVTCGETGNITSIGVWCAEGGDGAGTVKIALYDNVAAPALLHAGGAAAIPGEGAGTWVDIDISGTPVAVTLNDIVRVVFNVSIKAACQGASSGGNYDSVTYANFPPANLSKSDSNELIRMRIYITASGGGGTLPIPRPLSRPFSGPFGGF